MDISLLVSLLVTFIPMLCLMGLILVGGGLVLFVFLRGARTTAQRFSDRPEATGEAFLAGAALRPWQDAAWSDLAARWEGWWRAVTSPGRQASNAQGVVKSLADRTGPGWLAFTLERQQVRNATLVLKTSDRRLVLTVTSGGVLDPNVRGSVTLDGQPHGTLAVTYPNVVYRTSAGAEARWVAELRWNNERRAGGRLLARDVRYDPITLHGQPLAALTDTWIRYPHPQSTRPLPPAFQNLSQPLTPPEQEVLLVALALGLYYDDLRKRKVVYDW